MKTIKLTNKYLKELIIEVLKEDKSIRIKSCYDCPYYDHSGGFTPGGAQPICAHPNTIGQKGYSWTKRVIPFEVKKDSGRPINVPKEIPKWCPL